MSGGQELGATLVRKFFHSDEKEPSAYEKFFKNLCEIDKHTVGTGNKAYKHVQKSKEAAKALLTFTTVFDAPVAWPSAEELANNKKASLARQERFGKQWKNIAMDAEAEEALPLEQGHAALEDAPFDFSSEMRGVIDEEEQELEEAGMADETDDEVEEPATTGDDELGTQIVLPMDVDELNDIEKQIVLRLHTSFLSKRGLPVDGVAPDAVLGAIRMACFRHDRVRTGVTTELIKAFIVAEQTVLHQATPAPIQDDHNNAEPGEPAVKEHQATPAPIQDDHDNAEPGEPVVKEEEAKEEVGATGMPQAGQRKARAFEEAQLEYIATKKRRKISKDFAIASTECSIRNSNDSSIGSISWTT